MDAQLPSDFRWAEALAQLPRRLQPSPRDAASLLKDAADFRRLRRALGRRRASPASAVARLLRGASPEVLLLLAAWADRVDLRAALEDYRTRSAHLKPALTGRDLQALGIRPGPVYRAILDALRDARLDGRARTREDEMALVRRRFRRAMSNEQ